MVNRLHSTLHLITTIQDEHGGEHSIQVIIEIEYGEQRVGLLLLSTKKWQTKNPAAMPTK